MTKKTTTTKNDKIGRDAHSADRTILAVAKFAGFKGTSPQKAHDFIESAESKYEHGIWTLAHALIQARLWEKGVRHGTH